MTWTRNEETPVAFRGQAYSHWRTLPKLFRPDVRLFANEKNAVRDLVSVHPQEFRDDHTMFDRLVRMQHFELPTRLLDVTTNPLVALYFASAQQEIDGRQVNGKVQAFFLPPERQRYYDSDRVSCMANYANLTIAEKDELAEALETRNAREFNRIEIVKRLVSFVRIEKPHFEQKVVPLDLELPVFVKPKMSNRRILAQSGAFLIYGQLVEERDFDDEELGINRVIVPVDAKDEIRSQLERLGIHASALFPEIDKAAEFIVKRYANEGV